MTKKPQDDGKEIKELLQKLFKAVQVMSSASEEQKRISKELMKVMSLLNSGFVDSAEDANKLIDTIKDNGFSLTDEFIKKWAKARKATDEDLKNIIQRFHDIDGLNDDIVDSAKDYTELLEDQIGSIETTIDLSSKLLQGHKKITEAIQASKKQATALAGSTGDVAGLTEKILQKKVDVTNMFSGMFSGMEDGKALVENIRNDIDSLVAKAGNSEVEVSVMFNPLTKNLDKEVERMLKNIDDEKSKRLQGLRDYYASNTELQDKIAKSMAAQDFSKDMKFDVDTSDIMIGAKLLQKGTSEYQNALDTLTKIVSDNNIGQKVGDGLENMIKLMSSGTELSQEQGNEYRKQIDMLGDVNKLMVTEFNTRMNDLDVLKNSIVKEKSRLAIIGKYTNQLTAARGVVTKIGEGFDYINSILPENVGDLLGLSKISLSLMDAHEKGVEKFAEHVKEGGDLTQSMGVYMAEIGPSIRTALNPMMLLVAGGAMLFQTLRTAVDTYKDMASSMKISIKQAKDLHGVGLDTLTSSKNQFATMQDIQDVQVNMIEYGASIYELNSKGSKELAISLTEVGKAFGYGTERAADLQTIFTQLGANDDLALNLQTNLGLMAEMAGLSPQIISQDLIDGADEIATYFAGMPEQAAQAALGIRKVGMSIKQAGQIADKMLDREGFMTDMYELQAMTAGGIDFSRAFDKGLMGDIEGMTKDIMSNIGTTADYNKMDYLTRVKIAKTLGMSADELGKSVKLNEQISQFSGMEKEALEANKDRIGDISKLNKDQIKDRLNQLQSTDKLAVAWDKIKGVLLKALIPLAESFAGAIDMISPIVDLIVGGLKGVGLVIKLIVPIVKGILTPFKFIGDIIGKITGYLDDSAASTQGLGAVVNWVSTAIEKAGKYAEYFGMMIGTWALLFKMPDILSSVASTFKTILSFIPGIGTIFGSLTSGFGGIFSGMGKQAKDAAKESSDPIVSMTTKIHDSMVGMVDGIKSSMDSMVAHVKNSISSASDSISKGLSKSPTTKLMEGVKKEGNLVTTTLSSQVKKSANDMKNAMTDGSVVSRKKLREIRDESSNLIPKSNVKNSFGVLTSIGTKALSAMAIKSATSFLFAAKDGEQKLSGMGGEMQGVLEMAAVAGSSFLAESLQQSMDNVFSDKIEDKLTRGFSFLGDYLSKTLSGGFNNAGSAGKKMLSKVGSMGESVFSKMTSLGKSLFPKTGKGLTDILESVKPKKDLNQQAENIKKLITNGKNTDKVTKPKIPSIDVPKPPSKEIDVIGSIFKNLSSVIKSVWSTIKSIVMDIVQFLGNALKSITSAVGKSIENLLKGIGNGLSSFKTSALKGAASLVIVSSALWITSKALENFGNVGWDSVGKGIITLGGLTIAATALGKVSGQVLKGAIAIALLGASLIPAAYALNMFGEVNWSALAKAGVSLVGLGVAAGVIGGMLPYMLMGAVGIAALGAAMIPMAFAMKMFNEVEWGSLAKAGAALVGFGIVAAGFGAVAPLILAGAVTIGVASVSLVAFAGSVSVLNLSMKSIDVTPLRGLVDTLLNVSSISVASLIGVATGISAIAMSMSALSVGSTISKLFGGDSIKDLERLANLAEPLNTINGVISQLSASITDLANVIENVNFDNIKKLNDIDVKSIDQDVNQRINTVNGQVKNYSEPSIGYKIAPQQTQTANVMPPKKQSVAQDVKIHKFNTTKESDENPNERSKAANNTQNSYYENNSDSSEVYNRPGMDTKKLEMLLMRLIQLQEATLKTQTDINIDGQKLGTILKKGYNN